MDSGNSGSMQSSSGGDEEYDSRAESISAFLTTAGAGSVNHANDLMLNPPPSAPPHPPPTHHHNMFDPLSNFFNDPLSSSSSRSSLQLSNTTNPNSLLNLDMVWSRSLRSEPNCTDLGNLFSSSSSSSAQQLFATTTATNFSAGNLHNFPQGITASIAKSPSISASASALTSVSGLNMDQANNGINNSMNMVRNPKKRSRASRRAPTTVLTTDTTNFRAMVQEFTGIPAPPFTSSPFPRTRLDLFSSPTSNFRSNSTTHLDSWPQPSYLLRPFAQKLNPTTIPFVSPSTNSSPSSILEALASSSSSTTTTITTNIINNNHSNNSNSTSINYQLPQNLLMQNPILNLQPLLGVPPKFPISNSPILETKPQGSLDITTNDSHLKIGVLEELGLSHAGHLQNFVSSDDGATLPIRHSDNNNPTTNSTNWYAAGGGGGGECGKVNKFSASASDFHRDKGQENVAATTRTEGMVESWICSSD